MALARKRFSSRGEIAALAVIFVVIGWFYTWTATSAYQGLDFKPGDLEYYNLLVDGFRDGHLSLAFEGDPGIHQLKDPYDPEQNAPYRILDISYFKGRYYIYFGPTPVLTLLLPWRLITGVHLPTRLAAVVFCCAGYGLSLLLLLALRQRFFRATGSWPVVFSAVLLGLANMAPALLRRAAVYELAIACAYFFVMLTFVALFVTLKRGRYAVGWLALASTAYGLAILARPTCLFGALVFVPVLIWTCWTRRDGLRQDWKRWLAAAALPAAVIMVGLLLYNYLRFGAPFEFGQIYQLTSRDMGKVKAFSWGYLPFNAWLYLLMPPQFSAYFPFFLNATPPPMPPGYDGLDDLYGVFPSLPILAVASAGWWSLRRGSVQLQRELVGWCALMAAWTVTVFGVFVFFSGATIRYYLDFLPGALILTCLGGWSLLQRFNDRGVLRKFIGATLIVLGLYSVTFAVMVSFQHGGILRKFNPTAFDRLAYRFNRVSAWYDRLANTTYGPVTVEVKFPRDRRGKFEPLYVSGAFPSVDYLWVYYTDDEHIQIGNEHTNFGGTSTQPIRIDYSVAHTLEIDAGFLYPPQQHPYFRGREREAEQRVHTLRTVVDGVPFLDKRAEFYDPTTTRLYFGRSAQSGTFGRAFTGEVLKISKSAPQPVIDTTPREGVVKMALIFPRDRVSQREPLVVTGRTGKGDILYVEYVDPLHVRFVLDHWGVGAESSDVILIQPEYIQLLEIGLGSLFPYGTDAEKKRLVVKMNGATVLDRDTAFHPAPLESQAFGSNPIGGSTCGPVFTGKILSIARRPAW